MALRSERASNPFATHHDDLPADPFLPPPPQQGLVVAGIGRSFLIVLLLALLLAGAGVAYGIKRKPVYEAASTLQIGANINPNSAGYAGFVQSETSLATTFSRAVTATDVLRRIQTRTGLQPAQSASRLSATPVPDGAAIQVIGTGARPASAIGLANAGAAALIAHESPKNFSGSANALYRQYTTQSKVVANARAQVDKLRGRIANQGRTPGTTRALVQAESTLASAQVRATALSSAYTQAIEAQPSASNLLTPLSAAVTAKSDRTHKIELFGFIGLAAGLLLGSAIAILREQRRRNRSSLAR